MRNDSRLRYIEKKLTAGVKKPIRIKVSHYNPGCNLDEHKRQALTYYARVRLGLVDFTKEPRRIFVQRYGAENEYESMSSAQARKILRKSGGEYVTN